MQNKPNIPLKSFTLFFHFLLLLLQVPAHRLTTDGLLLLSFKHSVLSDPLSVLQSWNSTGQTPCSWTGVICSDVGDPASDGRFRVTGLVLPSSQLLGSVSPELFHIQHLTNVDLSDNLFNGTLPSSIFNSSHLQALSLSGNKLAGELPESVTGIWSLKLLNLSGNALSGTLPGDFSDLKNLTVLSLRGNYFSGSVPIGFDSVKMLDLSSNRLNGSLPVDFGGQKIRYLNLSYNRISGSISAEFAGEFPSNATVDLSFNNLTGAIPMSPVLIEQKPESFSGNSDLCGIPLKILCLISSNPSIPPNFSVAIPPAIAVIPTDPGKAGDHSGGKGALKPGLVAAISVTNMTAIAVLAIIILYVYQLKHRRRRTETEEKTEVSVLENEVEKSAQEHSKFVSCPCLNMKPGEESSSETGTSCSDSEATVKNRAPLASLRQSDGGDGELVALDEDIKFDLETLLKAAAYVLGTSGGSIVYKAVVADGTAFAVRRIGGDSCCVKRKKDFERQVREIAKVKHRNLLRVRGFHWGEEDEKLIICDYASNGTLASSIYRSRSSSWAFNFPVEMKLRIARGLARGLAHIHEKKQVHGNIKPRNILLDSRMEPIISDLGLDRLISMRANRTRLLGSTSTSTGQCWAETSQEPTRSPYEAPESQQNPKPNPKWDVYSFGVILIELLGGRVDSSICESSGRNSTNSALEEEKDVGVMKMGEERAESLLTLGFRCASLVPQTRPNMREVHELIENFMEPEEHARSYARNISR